MYSYTFYFICVFVQQFSCLITGTVWLGLQLLLLFTSGGRRGGEGKESRQADRSVWQYNFTVRSRKVLSALPVCLTLHNTSSGFPGIKTKIVNAKFSLNEYWQRLLVYACVVCILAWTVHADGQGSFVITIRGQKNMQNSISQIKN